MALTSNSMVRIGGGAGQTLWMYKTTDTEAVMSASGYFDSMAGHINTGDILLAAVDMDGTPGVHVYSLANSTDAAGGTVTIVNLTVVT